MKPSDVCTECHRLVASFGDARLPSFETPIIWLQRPSVGAGNVTGEPRPSRFIFWSTAPFLVAFLFMPLLVWPPATGGRIALVACDTLALLVLLGLYDRDRFWWCWRGAGGIAFAGFAFYLGAMIVAGHWFGPTPMSAFNAFCGLVVFGLPGLWFAVFGRLTLRPEHQDEFDDWSDA